MRLSPPRCQGYFVLSCPPEDGTRNCLGDFMLSHKESTHKSVHLKVGFLPCVVCSVVAVG